MTKGVHTVFPEDEEGEVGALCISRRGCNDGVVWCHLHPRQVLHIDIAPLVQQLDHSCYLRQQ